MSRTFFKLTILLLSAIISAVFLCSCVGVEKTVQDKESVTVSFLFDTDAVDGESVYKLKRGQSFRANLKVKDGYKLSGCDNTDSIITGSVGDISVSIERVLYSMRIKLYTQAIEENDGNTFIKYMLNGGEYAGGGSSPEYFTESGISEYHLRINTNRGVDVIERSGYVLYGWNTEADGSGEHIGLGSRVTVQEGSTLILYAEWAQETEEKYFTYTDNIYTNDPDDCMITGYSGGSRDMLVIPHYLSGKKVTRLNGDVVRSRTIDKLVINEFVNYIGDRTFWGCNISHLYLFDTVEQISDNSFDNGVQTLHLNAGTAPRFSSGYYNANFAEIIDRLIINKDNKKLVVFGGCNLAYGMDSSLLDEAYGDEYVILDIGINGNTNMTAQLDCVKSYLAPGDILVHAPEPMGEYSMFYNLKADWILLQMVEHNYDLLTHTSAKDVPGLFDALAEFNSERKDMPPADINYKNKYFNEYGDYSYPRNTIYGDASVAEIGGAYNFDYLQDNAIGLRNSYYKELSEAGVKVYITACPVNYHALTDIEIEDEIWDKYDDELRAKIDGRFATIISLSHDYIFAGRYFYDTDYHLTLEGAKMRTARLAEDLKAYL